MVPLLRTIRPSHRQVVTVARLRISNVPSPVTACHTDGPYYIGTITRRGKGDPYDHHHSTYVHDISADNTTVNKHDKTVES